MSKNASARVPAAQPRTRTQRRAAQRQQAKQQQHVGNSRLIGLILGTAVTLIILAGIAVYALNQQHKAATPNNPSLVGLTNPNALSPQPSLIAAGQKAPGFTLMGADNKLYDLSSERGHIVFLEFFAVWCPVCHAEAPTIARIEKTYASKGVRVWSILSNPYGKNYEISGGSNLSLATRQDLSWYRSQYNVHYPQLIDTQFATVNSYGINGYPGLYVIGKNSDIVYSSSGRMPYSTLAGALNKALAAKGPAAMGGMNG